MSVENAISIITPFFNQGVLFEETYQSVINQTFTDWEWIIVDDGSKDPLAVKVLKELDLKGNPRVKILHLPENQGLPSARNAGVKAAAHEYIFFLDSDDLIEPDYLEKALIVLSFNPAFAFANSWSTGFGAVEYDWRVGFEKGKDFLTQNWVAFAGLFRKKVLLDVPFNESRREGLEDWEFWLTSAAKGYWGYTIPERLFHYRIHDTARKKWKNWDNGKKQETVKREFIKKFAPLLHSHFPRPQMAKVGDPIPVLEGGNIPGMDGSVAGTGPSTGSQPVIPRSRPLIMVVLPWQGSGGVEQFTLTWMKALKDQLDYILVTTNAAPDNDRMTFKPISRAVFHLAHLTDASLYPFLIRDILQRYAPDLIVLSNAEPFYHLLPYLHSTFSHIPVIDINHMEDRQWQEGGYPSIAARFSPYIARHITISDWLKQFMLAKGVDREKTETIYINTDTVAIQPLSVEEKALKRREYFPSEAGQETAAGPAILLFSGRLTQQKNVLLLPEIAETLVRKNLHFLMVLCGDGPDREMLEEKIYQKKLGRYFLLKGSVEHSTVLSYMQAATVLLLPSAWEGIATVIYEAMAAGLPVIATDVGGQRELLAPDCGFLVPPGDAGTLIREMADGLETLLKDPALRSRLAVAARRRVETFFDSRSSFERLYALFNEVVLEYGEVGREVRPPASGISPPVSGIKGPVLDEYLAFTRQWNILQSGKSRPAWKDLRFYRALRRAYKITRGKRPLSYLWKTG